ncbi:MAG: mannose-6-phosphate isomerase, class I, partial [Cellulomonas sp.]|nr:mannose-6-phosphate isomerase, class I [Cellulomonas sp.]
MLRITGATQAYAWGSSTAIQDLIGVQDPPVIAEVWFGAHPKAPSRLQDESGTRLDAVIDDDADAALGSDVVARFGASLPYLLKVIAAEQPLSLQVHPHAVRAGAGFLEEDAAGVPLDSPARNYKDRNHKPELVYALTEFEAVCGFRAPRRVAEMFATLDTPLAHRLHAVLVADPSSAGIQTVFTRLLEPRTRPSRDEVHAIAAACQ